MLYIGAPDKDRGIESKYIEDAITWKLEDILMDLYNVNKLDLLKLYNKESSNINRAHPYSVYLTLIVAYTIFQNPTFFTQDFNVINIPKSFSKEDADNLISILRMAGHRFGLSVRRLDTYKFITQWEKEYILKSDKRDNEFFTSSRSAMAKYIKDDLSNCTKDILEIYFYKSEESLQRYKKQKKQ